MSLRWPLFVEAMPCKLVQLNCHACHSELHRGAYMPELATLDIYVFCWCEHMSRCWSAIFWHRRHHRHHVCIACSVCNACSICNVVYEMSVMSVMHVMMKAHVLRPIALLSKHDRCLFGSVWAQGTHFATRAWHVAGSQLELKFITSTYNHTLIATCC